MAIKIIADILRFFFFNIGALSFILLIKLTLKFVDDFQASPPSLNKFINKKRRLNFLFILATSP